MAESNLGIYGLGVMGRNLALNFAGRGKAVSVYNRDDSAERADVKRFLEDARGRGIIGAADLDSFVSSIRVPRTVILMLKAGAPVDDAIELLAPILSKGDIIVDCGNSHYLDTDRRLHMLRGRGILFVGCGVSGGEEGALRGPSLMPGGAPEAWDIIRPLLVPVAARRADGTPCCEWIGPGGAGHFVKMAHNGIEYALMQVFAEAYDLMRRVMGMPADAIAAVVSGWNRGRLKGYLAGMIVDILETNDGDGEPLLDRIRDSAGEKGTGNRAVAAALDLASPATVMAEAVFARMISSRSELRARMSRDFPVTSSFAGERESVLGDLEKGVYCSAAVSCDQGFALMNAASKEYGWNLDLASVARSWRAGCIIQSEMMGEIEGVFLKSPGAATILVEEPFAGAIRDGHAGWRRVLSAALSNGVPAPALSSALACFDGCRSARLPADLLQAMRDYFGAHGFERRDNPGGGPYHGEWKRSPRE